jgi:hypothetical protein
VESLTRELLEVLEEILKSPIQILPGQLEREDQGEKLTLQLFPVLQLLQQAVARHVLEERELPVVLRLVMVVVEEDPLLVQEQTAAPVQHQQLQQVEQEGLLRLAELMVVREELVRLEVLDLQVILELQVEEAEEVPGPQVVLQITEPEEPEEPEKSQLHGLRQHKRGFLCPSLTPTRPITSYSMPMLVVMLPVDLHIKQLHSNYRE